MPFLLNRRIAVNHFRFFNICSFLLLYESPALFRARCLRLSSPLLSRLAGWGLGKKAACDQAEKGVASRTKTPAKVGKTGGAEGMLPGVAGKPGKVRGGLSLDNATGRIPEAADFKGYSGWVEKDVLMSPVFAHGRCPAGDGRAAEPAENGLFPAFILSWAVLRIVFVPGTMPEIKAIAAQGRRFRQPGVDSG